MIKNLLNADEDPPEGTKVIIEDTILAASPSAPDREHSAAAAENSQPPAETPANFEIPENAQFPTAPAESAEVVEEPAPLDESAESYELLMKEIENLSPEEFDRLEREMNLAPENAPAAAPPAENIAAPLPEEGKEKFESAANKVESEAVPTIFQSDYTPPSTAETIRNSGLAWSAGVVLFGSVIFMMIFGWIAGLFFGSPQWGIVVGIVLGGIIGIFQLFRITSQIYKK